VYQQNPYGGIMHSTDLTLRGIGMGVEQAMANPMIKVAVVGLAAYGAAVALGWAKPKAKRRRNPAKRRKTRKKSRRRRRRR
jgi:hypothetical protein